MGSNSGLSSKLPTELEGNNLELKDYLRILRRHWIIVLACLLLGILMAAAMSLLTKPTYTAKTQLFVAIQSANNVTELQQGNSFSQARVQSYVKTVTTPAVLQPVIDSLGLDTTPGDLAAKIRASADLNTVLINVSVEDQSPAAAAAVAQAVAESLISTVETLEAPAVGAASPVKLSLVTPASAPDKPSAPNTQVNILLGAAIGLGVGLALALLRTTLDTRVRNQEDVQRLVDLPMLGGIVFDAEAATDPLLTDSGLQSPRSEAFRQIRTNLQFSRIGTKSSSLLVTSSLPGEGKSTTATNLAIAMSQAGHRVLLVDADLRRPSVANYLGLEGAVGLTTVLVGAASLQDVTQQWGENDLHVLASGRIPPNPSELLSSNSMSRLIADMERSYDVVVVDAPPLIPVTDASILAQKVGGVVLVVGATKVRSQDLAESMSALKLVGAHTMGTVVNLLPARGPDAYAYGSYTYESQPDTRRRASRTSPRIASRTSLKKTRKRAADFDSVVTER